MTLDAPATQPGGWSNDDGLTDHCACCAHRRGTGENPCGGPYCPCSAPVAEQHSDTKVRDGRNIH